MLPSKTPEHSRKTTTLNESANSKINNEILKKNPAIKSEKKMCFQLRNTQVLLRLLNGTFRNNKQGARSSSAAHIGE